MRTNKLATIATLIISLLTFFVCALLFNHIPRPFGYDISLACFGSALLGGVVAYSAYSAERRKAMESFWQESLYFINEIKKLKYLKIEEYFNLVRDCFEEEYTKNSDEEKTHNAKSVMIEWIEKNQFPDDGTADYRTKLEKKYDELIEDCKKDLNVIMQAYVDFSQTNIHSLMNAYESLDFIRSNHTVRKKAYYDIYKIIENIHSLCQQDSDIFRLAIDGNSQLLLSIEKIIKLNQVLYTEKEGKIYASLADNLDNNLEWFRSKIYHAKPEEITHIPLNNVPDPDDQNSDLKNEPKESDPKENEPKENEPMETEHVSASEISV